MDKKELEKNKQLILKRIRETDNFAVLVSDPDLDAVGSGLAMEEILEQFGKRVKLFTSYDLKDYSYLPRLKKFIHSDISTLDLGQFETVIFVDSGSPERVLDVKERTKEFKLPKSTFVINIDHHKNALFGRLNYVSDKFSSAGEAIYRIFKEKITLTPSLSTNLLGAIIGDTGCFKHPNTSPETLRISAVLIEHCADHKKIIKNIFYSVDRETIRINIEALKTLEVKKVGKYEFSTLIFDPKKHGLKDIGREQRLLAQEYFLRAVKGINFSIAITPLEGNMTKLSFRSLDRQVRPIAEHFGGGGHKEAAGATVNMSPEEFFKELEKYLKSANLPEVEP